MIWFITSIQHPTLTFLELNTCRQIDTYWVSYSVIMDPDLPMYGRITPRSSPKEALEFNPAENGSVIMASRFVCVCVCVCTRVCVSVSRFRNAIYMYECAMPMHNISSGTVRVNLRHTPHRRGACTMQAARAKCVYVHIQHMRTFDLVSEDIARCRERERLKWY